MRNMKYILFTICLFGLLSSFAMADAGVNKLQMFEQNGELVLRVDVSGPFQFSHQIAEAEDGKPFRILVDIFPAVHNLPQKSFVNLPPSVIQSIRTSQYSVEPEKIVRVVCDLKQESVYRIDKKGSSVFIYIPDEKNTNFPRWTSADNNSEKDHKASPSIPVASKESKARVLASKPKANNNPTPEVAVQPESTYYQPQKSDIVAKEWSKAEPVSQKPSQPVNEPVKPKQPAKPEAQTPPAAGQQATSDRPAEKAAEKKVPSKPEPVVAKSDKTEKPAVTTKNEEKFVPPSTPMVLADQSPNPPVQEKATKVADKKATPKTSPKAPEVASKSQDKNDKSSKSTSHFRRQPTLPARLKGTIVAEFPTRMVIKYTPGLSRDPFESLIGEKKKGTEEFGQQKLLDIETARLVGILESTSGKNRALVEDLDGYGYILKQGDRIKKGYVSKIYSDKALFQIFEYGWSRAQALHLDNE
jgi:hypothetical protein